ncbi:hypothetical protein UT300012_21660 [Paraclostridium bifermentans]
MRILVDGRDLLSVELGRLKGLDVTIVSYEGIDENLVNSIRGIANDVIVEDLRNRMQMITFIRLQLLNKNNVFFSKDKAMLALLCRKNCAYDFELTVAYIVGMLRLENLDKIVEDSEELEQEVVNEECVIVDLEVKREEKAEELKEMVKEDSLKAKLDRVRAFREAN